MENLGKELRKTTQIYTHLVDAQICVQVLSTFCTHNKQPIHR